MIWKFEFGLIYVPGPNFTADGGVSGKQVAEHQAYIEGLRRQGILIQGGPFPDNVDGTDRWHGLPVVSVYSMDQATALITQDPAVQAGALSASVKPWHIKFGF